MILTKQQHAQAKCMGSSFSFAYYKLPGEGKQAHQRRVKDAIETCNSGCPIKEECLQIAMAEPWNDRIAGGTTPPERKQMRKAAASA